jgi:hypothetical protein
MPSSPVLLTEDDAAPATAGEAGAKKDAIAVDAGMTSSKRTMRLTR